MDWVRDRIVDQSSIVRSAVELGARFTLNDGDHRLGAISTHYGWVVDMGIVLANDYPLVGNSGIGGLDIPACVQFDQREVGAFGRTPVRMPDG